MTEYLKPIHPGAYFCEALISLAWTIAFWTEVGNADHAACQGSTWAWSLYAKICYLGNTIACCIGMATCRPAILKSTNPGIVFVVFIFSILCSLLVLAGIALIVGMIISFANIDRCSDLHGIILAQFIFLMIGLGLIALFCCYACVGVCYLGSVQALSDFIRSSVARLFCFHCY